ncbi:MAG: chitin deacetylase [Rhodospirillaceae bacterium]|nr:chitin deacetylase [Rhodospirillaceae bacterium]
MYNSAVRSARHVALCFLAIFAVLAPAGAFAANSAVIVMYHRFGESKYPHTNTTVEQFKAHLSELKDGDYVVKPIPEIVAAIRSGEALPEKTVGISIDDAFLSVYRVGWPMLQKAGLPFTLFVATEPLDRRFPGYMSWDQLRELVKAGVTIGSQTASHLHMPMESESRNLEDLRTSNDRFKKELGFVPKMIAYPYGEYSLAVGKITREVGFDVGFGQHSGVIYKNSDFLYLPRFAFNEAFGDVQRFRLAIRALPFKVSDVTPQDPYLKGKQNPPPFGFTVDKESARGLSRVACYATRQGKINVERLGDRRIEVRALQAFPAGRTRMNCTLLEKDGRWRWLGMQFLVPKPGRN